MSRSRRVPFDETYLDASYDWLSDPELARLTMSAPQTRAEQRAWYDALPGRSDYAIWGIEHDGVPVGAMGIKRIGQDDGAEYFMYIGDRAYWGRRIAEFAFHEMAREVRDRGLRWLYGRVAKINERSLAVKLRMGFEILRDDGDTWWVVADLAGPLRVAFDERFLLLSYDWLSDAGMARLTMSGDITPESQARWWRELPERTDYAVWGIEYAGVPVGAMGIKQIGVDDGAEYFMYIGDRAYWGRGIAAWSFAQICAEVRRRGLRYLYGRIGKHNDRSLAVHLREGFQVVGEDGDVWLVACDLSAR